MASGILAACALALESASGACANGRDEAPATAEAREIGGAFAEVAQRVAPSVVRITTRQKSSPGKTPGPMTNPFEGTPFERFFKEFHGLDCKR